MAGVGRAPEKGGGALRIVKKAVLPGVLLFAGYCSVYGGEHSWFELREARASVEEERAALQVEHAAIDSLSAWVDSLQSDSATLERVARERYGMIRPGERLYRFESADSGARPDTSVVPGR